MFTSKDNKKWKNKCEMELQNKKINSTCKRCEGMGECYEEFTISERERLTEYFPDHIHLKWSTCSLCKGDGYI
jgi:hypothetical protein